MISLPDINVLIALLDPKHRHAQQAHDWFETNEHWGWATCPLTINGCVRILSQQVYLKRFGTVSDAVEMLRAACARSSHQFWSEDISLLDSSRFCPDFILGPSNITDTYLLALAVKNDGCLITLDQGIRLDSVVGAEQRHLKLLA